MHLCCLNIDRAKRRNARSTQNSRAGDSRPASPIEASCLLPKVSSMQSVINLTRASLVDPSVAAFLCLKANLLPQKSETPYSPEELQLLVSRIAIALLRNVSRDMTALNRLEGRTNIKAGTKNERWWKQQIGISIEKVPLHSWGEARILSSRQLKARGYAIDQFDLHAGQDSIQIRWRLRMVMQ